MRKKLTKGRSIDILIIVSIYISCLFNQEPIPLTFISKKCKIPRVKISRVHRAIRRELNLEIPSADLKKLIEHFSNILNLSEDVRLKAKYLIDQIIRKKIEQGKEPCSIIGGVIYLSGILCGFKCTQQEIADCLRITQATVRKRYKEISRKIERINIKDKIEEKPLEVKEIKRDEFPKVFITNNKIIDILSDNWKSLDVVIETLNIEDELDKRFVKIKLKILERKEIIMKKLINTENYWKIKD